MRLFKCLLVFLIMLDVCWADEISVTIEPLTDSELIELKETTAPRAVRDSYKTVHITYQDKATYQFIWLGNIPTSVKYNNLLNCDGVDYPVVMLKTDSSFEKASLSVTFLINRLFIFDDTLKLLNKYESTYRSEEDDSGFYIDKKHIFTLNNVEKFACDRIKELK
ncbi:hypothetical protein THO17_06030 [Marinomonas sp. THO17]